MGFLVTFMAYPPSPGHRRGKGQREATSSIVILEEIMNVQFQGIGDHSKHNSHFTWCLLLEGKLEPYFIST